ncbi:MAG: hypothetical protein ACRDDK_05285 [Cetobacterium sp.]|uniref:hypothetical protein n=1 Tax=Cetobacterium sp. TaxID=2071632 RepID=UPI003EE6905E
MIEILKPLKPLFFNLFMLFLSINFMIGHIQKLFIYQEINKFLFSCSIMTFILSLISLLKITFK